MADASKSALATRLSPRPSLGCRGDRCSAFDPSPAALFNARRSCGGHSVRPRRSRRSSRHKRTQRCCSKRCAMQFRNSRQIIGYASKYAPFGIVHKRDSRPRVVDLPQCELVLSAERDAQWGQIRESIGPRIDRIARMSMRQRNVFIRGEAIPRHRNSHF
jgi:hypothetical protein